MAPRISIHPSAIICTGNSDVILRMDGDESWTSTTQLLVAFCSRLRRCNSVATVEVFGEAKKGFVTCRCKTPNWGCQEEVKVHLYVNKVEAGVCRFLFYLPVQVTRAAPPFAVASEINEITLWGDNVAEASMLAQPGGFFGAKSLVGGSLATARDEVDVHSPVVVRVVAENGDLVSIETGRFEGDTIRFTVGRIALTGAVHFEVSLNNVDFDQTYLKWQHTLALLEASQPSRIADQHRPQVEDLRRRMRMASVVWWETPILTDLFPSYAYVGDQVEAWVQCSGYPAVDTGSVVINLSDRFSHDARNQQNDADLQSKYNVDVSAAVDVQLNRILFTTPHLETAAELYVSVSLNGGRTFSGPCMRQLTVRRRPCPRGVVVPRCGPMTGGTEISIPGSDLLSESRDGSIWIRLQCQGLVKKFVAIYMVDSTGEEVRGILPHMRECVGVGQVEAVVSVSLDGGNRWLEPPSGVAQQSIILYPPPTLAWCRPGRFCCMGGIQLTIRGDGLFQSPDLAVRVNPIAEKATLIQATGAQRAAVHTGVGAASSATLASVANTAPTGAVVDAGPTASLGPSSASPGKFSIRQLVFAKAPRVAFVGDALVEVTLNGIDWIPVPSPIRVTEQPDPAPTSAWDTDAKVAIQRAREARRDRRIQDRAAALAAAATLPPGLAARQAALAEVSAMLGVGLRLGRNSRGEHCVAWLRPRSLAIRRLKIGDVIAGITEMSSFTSPAAASDPGKMIYLSQALNDIDVASLLRGPAGSGIVLTLANGQRVQLDREFKDSSEIEELTFQPPAAVEMPNFAELHRRLLRRAQITRAKVRSSCAIEALKFVPPAAGADEDLSRLSRVSLFRAKRHYQALSVPPEGLNTLCNETELGLADIASAMANRGKDAVGISRPMTVDSKSADSFKMLTQWDVVVRLIELRPAVTVRDLHRFGIERPSVVHLVAKRNMQTSDRPESEVRFGPSRDPREASLTIGVENNSTARSVRPAQSNDGSNLGKRSSTGGAVTVTLTTDGRMVKCSDITAGGPRDEASEGDLASQSAAANGKLSVFKHDVTSSFQSKSQVRSTRAEGNSSSQLSSALYDGEISGTGEADGAGLLRFGSGDIYRGEFLHGRMHGSGEWTYGNGDGYIGEFANGAAHGRGIYAHAGGTEVYEGEYASNLPHGRGRKRWADGSVYDGEWRRGKQHGEGEWTRDGARYAGGFRDGLPHGPGRFVNAAGDMYEGEWQRGKSHGYGAWFGSAGYVYDGQWIRGKAAGGALHRRAAPSRAGARTESDKRMLLVGHYQPLRSEGPTRRDPVSDVWERLAEEDLWNDLEGFIRAAGAGNFDAVDSRRNINGAAPVSRFINEPWGQIAAAASQGSREHSKDDEPVINATAAVCFSIENICRTQPLAWRAYQALDLPGPQRFEMTVSANGDSQPINTQSPVRAIDNFATSPNEGIGGEHAKQQVKQAALKIRSLRITLERLIVAGAQVTPVLLAAAIQGRLEVLSLLSEVVPAGELDIDLQDLEDELCVVAESNSAVTEALAVVRNWKRRDQRADAPPKRLSIGLPSHVHDAQRGASNQEEEMSSTSISDSGSASGTDSDDMIDAMMADTGPRHGVLNTLFKPGDDLQHQISGLPPHGGDVDLVKPGRLRVPSQQENEDMREAKMTLQRLVPSGLVQEDEDAAATVAAAAIGGNLSNCVVIIVEELELLPSAATHFGVADRVFLTADFSAIDDGRGFGTRTEEADKALSDLSSLSLPLSRQSSTTIPQRLTFHHSMALDIAPPLRREIISMAMDILRENQENVGASGREKDKPAAVPCADILVCGETSPTSWNADAESDPDVWEVGACRVELVRRGTADGSLQRLPVLAGTGDAEIGFITVRAFANRAIAAASATLQDETSSKRRSSKQAEAVSRLSGSGSSARKQWNENSELEASALRGRPGLFSTRLVNPPDDLELEKDPAPRISAEMAGATRHGRGVQSNALGRVLAKGGGGARGGARTGGGLLRQTPGARQLAAPHSLRRGAANFLRHAPQQDRAASAPRYDAITGPASLALAATTQTRPTAGFLPRGRRGGSRGLGAAAYVAGGGRSIDPSCGGTTSARGGRGRGGGVVAGRDREAEIGVEHLEGMVDLWCLQMP